TVSDGLAVSFGSLSQESVARLETSHATRVRAEAHPSLIVVRSIRNRRNLRYAYLEMGGSEVAAQSSEESFEGRVVGGKYKVGPLVGSGGMGTVWLGHHTTLGTRVAIKFIRPQFVERPDARRRFEIEARAAASVDSKHAVKVYDYGVTEDG